MRLSVGSALYWGLIVDPYIDVNGSNSVRLSAGPALYCGLIADPYIYINEHHQQTTRNCYNYITSYVKG